MAQKPETTFRARVSRDLKTLPDTAIFPIQQKTIVGDPDFFLCIRGRFVGLELKSQDGVVSPMQKHKLDTIRRAKGIGLVAYPQTWVNVLSMLHSIAKGNYDHSYV